MSDQDRNPVDPRLEKWLKSAAEVERARPRPNSQRFLHRLRPRLRETRASGAGGPWSTMVHACASLAAAGILAVTLYLVFRQPEESTAALPGSASVPVAESDDAFLIDNLDALERLAEVLADDVSSGDLDVIEVCDDLDLLQDTDLDAILGSLLEETG